MRHYLQAEVPLWQNTYLITDSYNVARRLYVQANGGLIGTELFSISTGGDAVKKGYISMEGLFSSRDLCKSKNGVHHWMFRWIHLCIIFPHLHPLQGPLKGMQSEVLLCFFSALFSFPDLCSSYALYVHGTFPCQWHKLIYAACPPATDLIQHKGTCINFTSSCGAKYTQTYNLKMSYLAICCFSG